MVDTRTTDELYWVKLALDDVCVGKIIIRHIGNGRYQLHGGRQCGKQEAIRAATRLNRMIVGY